MSTTTTSFKDTQVTTLSIFPKNKKRLFGTLNSSNENDTTNPSNENVTLIPTYRSNEIVTLIPTKPSNENVTLIATNRSNENDTTNPSNKNHNGAKRTRLKTVGTVDKPSTTTTITCLWHALSISPTELRCHMTLNNGQCFQWHEIHVVSNNIETKFRKWIGVVDEWIILLEERPDDTWFCCPNEDTTSTSNTEKIRSRLHTYFQISYSLKDRMIEWKKSDSTFFGVHCQKPGLRLIQLNPFECLISFITSSNNHIPRIHKLVDLFRSEYGHDIGTFQNVKYYRFPTVQEAFQSVTKERLEELGFGYRSNFLYETIHTLHRKGGESFLMDLRNHVNMSSEQKSMILRSLFMGVGPKVADCITLMSLNGYDCVPVDTHIYQLYQNIYSPTKSTTTTTTTNSTYDKQTKTKKKKSALTTKQYREIQTYFRHLFGLFAGWAQSYLFTTQLVHHT